MIIALYAIGLLLLIHGVYQLIKYLVISSWLKKRHFILYWTPFVRHQSC